MLVTLTGIFTQQALGQVSDDFSDGELASNPAWRGSSAHFTVNALHQLQLTNTVAGTSYLTVPFSFVSSQNVQWEIYVKQTFAGSASNFGRVYLASSQQDLTAALDGYYLQFGEAGANDAIELFRQSGLTTVSVFRATPARIASAVNARVRVTRSYAGAWSLLIDYSGGTNFTHEATGVDAVHTSASFFGIRCTYTVTNATRFFYDDFAIVSHTIPDVSPPEVSGIAVHSSTAVDLHFSEPPDPLTAQNHLNYLIPEGDLHPTSVVPQPDEAVRLTFATPFRNGYAQKLSVKGVKDPAGNVMADTTLNFTFFQPVPATHKDILITEIFADPTPSAGLPEAEFLELFNRSTTPFDLSGWQLTDGATTGPLLSRLLLPGEYLIVTPSAARTAFSDFGEAMGISSFPSLNNTSDVITLKDRHGRTIDSVSYSAAWYRSDEKKDGGYTLELIDPENVCEDMENWVATEDDRGGTPGAQNSVFANKPDLRGPKLISAFPVADTVLLLQFDEKLEKTLPATGHFSIDPGHPLKRISFATPALTSVYLTLAEPMRAGVKYDLHATRVYDCAGNVLEPGYSHTTFALPEIADSADVVINEILFNPRPTGVDFAELFNRSARFINLKHWKVGNLNNDSVANGKEIFENDFLLEPQAYLVLTENGNVLKGEYPRAKEETFVQVNLPSFPDDAGSLVLEDDQGKIIDAFSYTDQLHAVFIKEDEGVSLERISPWTPAHEVQNWKSASADAGFATPGYANANARAEGIADDAVAVEPEIFIPLSGQPDFAQIRYRFDRGGYVANIRIIDAQGREVKNLANNELLGTEGFFRWDGDVNSGHPARIGAYMVWVEVFDSTGTLKTFRKRVVIAREF